jgi:predicted nucleic acid-binding protein
MILIDANVIMYAAGAEHPHKRPSVALLERVAAGEVEATTDAEVLQEILHRYRAIGRWEDGRRVYDQTRRLFPAVVPVTAAVLDRARRLLDADGHIMARDALHAAIVMMAGFDAVCSYDRDFDRIRGLVRREPAAV